MPFLLKLWYWWIVLGLPYYVGRRLVTALSDGNRSKAWRAGRTLFYLGILIWCPYVLLARLLHVPVPILAILPIHIACLYGGLALQRWAEARSPSRAA